LRSEPAAAFLLLLSCASSATRAADLTVNITDGSNRPLVDAVVYAEPLGWQAPAPTQTPTAIIDQVNKRFVPSVIIVRTGTEIRFPNSDNFRHSIYSFSAAKVFTTKLYSGRQAPPVLFDRAGLVVLGCNIHDTMAAWVVVVNTPFFSKSATGGVAVIRDLTPGEYRIGAWYPSPAFTPVTRELRFAAAPVAIRMQVDASALPQSTTHP
jgi:plastocyanin